MNNIVWLASYPKSGNTWLRIFLNNLKSPLTEDVSINRLEHIAFSHSARREIFDNILPFSSSMLKAEELRLYYNDVYKSYSSDLKEKIFLKNHEAYTYTQGQEDFPNEVTSSAIYIIRNPLEVACSYANHRGCTLDQSIDFMNDSNYWIADEAISYKEQISQKLLSWSDHVESWTSDKKFPLLILRYEDMMFKPFETFKQIVSFLQYTESDTEIKKAIELSEFKVIKKQEDDHGFIEKLPGSSSFFRSGQIDSWKTSLNSEQINRIVDCHGTTMKKYGYLDGSNQAI